MAIKNGSQNIFDLKGLNLFVSPLVKNDNELIRAVNVETSPHGAKSKRSGYVSFLGNPDSSEIKDLFSWYKNDGSTFFLYRKSGTSLYYSSQGTGAWTVCGNGRVNANAHVGHAELGDTLIIGDGVGATRHTTNGTSFTNTSLAPVSEHFAQYQNRIYAAGTASDLFYSTSNDASNWSTSGTADSSSVRIPGGGRNSKLFTSNDRLIAPKDNGMLLKWDGYSLVDTATVLGPSSPYSVDQVEGYNFWINQNYGGLLGYGGVQPEILSNAVQPQFYNDSGLGMAGTMYDKAVGCAFRYDYFLTMGTVTDDITNQPVDNCILKYDVRHSEYLNWSFAHFPTAMHVFRDNSRNLQFIFGDVDGQCYRLSGTATTDAGLPISSEMQLTNTMGRPDLEKKYRWWYGIFSPGCEAQVAIAIGDTYYPGEKKWVELGSPSNGVISYRFPEDSRGRLLFIKIYESSKTKGYTFYGYGVNADIIEK